MIRSTLMTGFGALSDFVMDRSGAEVETQDIRKEEHPQARQARKDLRHMAGRLALDVARSYVHGVGEVARDQLKERMGHTAHRRYPVLQREPLLARIQEARTEGRSIKVHLGCGPLGKEIIAAVQDPRNLNFLLVGVEHHGFSFKPSKEELSGAVFHDGRWQFLLRDLATQGGADEIVAVAPAAPWQALERKMREGDAMALLFAENVTVFNEHNGDFDLLFQALKTGGRFTLYTEDATWSRDFAESLVGVFGLGVSIKEIPSSEAPPSGNLQRYPITYVVQVVKRK